MPYRIGFQIIPLLASRLLKVTCGPGNGIGPSRFNKCVAVKTSLPDELMTLVAAKFRMLSDPTRLAILRCLMEGGELNVSQIVSASGRGMANVSKHLKLLSDSGLVNRRKVGPFVLYRLDDPVVRKICTLVCDSLRRELELEMKRNKRLLGRGH